MRTAVAHAASPAGTEGGVAAAGGQSPMSGLTRVASRSLAAIGRHAVVALYDELALAPKPGLVSFVDTGSHCDMDARTFLRSLFALRHYFPAVAALGAQAAPFAALEAAGIAAEAQMLRATGGVNTHRGAIFSLGLLCAAAGRCEAQSLPPTVDHLRALLRECWGAALAERARRGRDSHGARAARTFGLRSAGAEAAAGFPVLFEAVWPSLREALAAGLPPARARLQALFTAMATLDDTNLAHRGGLQALRDVQSAARDFLRSGGAARPDAEDHAWGLHRELVARHLSPGGAADLLAAACWLQRVGA
jgi:triphosphoribosyl-dephospho-CoA synthase